MKPVLVATHRIFPATQARLREAATLVCPDTDRFDPRALHEALATAEAAMVFMPDRVDAAFLARAPRLRAIGAALKGYDNVDVAAWTERGVVVSIVPDLLTVPTAELAVGLIIGLARHLRAADAHARSEDFDGWTPRFYGLGLAGSTIGILGMGAIGRALARRLAGFDCELRYWDQSAVPSDVVPAGARGVDNLDAVLAVSDIVVVCLPLLPSTLHLLNDARLRRMRPGALLVNPARGSVVDEAAVARALEAGHLGGYAADAFELEDRSRSDRPLQLPLALRNHPATLFGAHIGSATVQARQAIEACAAENILDALAGRVPRNAINRVSLPSADAVRDERSRTALV